MAPSAAETTYRHTGRSVPSQWPPPSSRGNLWFHNVSDKMTLCLSELWYAHAKIVRVSPPVSRDRTTVPLVEPRYIVYKGIVVPCTLYTELTMVCEETSVGGHQLH